jgi:hypothetical protein
MSVLFFLAPATVVLLPASVGSGFLRNFAKSDFIEILECRALSVGSWLTGISGKECLFFFSANMSKSYLDPLR